MARRRPDDFPEIVRIPVAVIDLTAEVVIKILKHTRAARPAAMFQRHFQTKTRPIEAGSNRKEPTPWSIKSKKP